MAKKEECEAEIPVPPFLKSVDELHSLSEALSIFTSRYNELQKHLELIHNSIDARFKKLKEEEEEEEVEEKGDESSLCTSSIYGLCISMSSRGLRKYIATHLNDIPKLREEAPIALKRAQNPPKLVLDCIGRFYLQGSKAYSTKDPHLVTARRVSILILEFFLLSQSFNDIHPSIKLEAHTAALAWRKRIIKEGGFSIANTADARGLLLFLASYGIPSDFQFHDLMDLVCLSNPADISDALRCSPFLAQRIPDIIQGMVKKGMCVPAVYAVCAFGIEDKFPPQNILETFLHQSQEAWKSARDTTHDLPMALKEANIKQLTALKAVNKCLRNCKVDPKKLSGWDIEGKIAQLKKDISDLDQGMEEKRISKRKADMAESSKKLRTQELKRARPSPEQRADGSSMNDGRFSRPLNGYSGASSLTALSGAGAGLLPGPSIGSLGVSSELAAGTAGGLPAGNGGALPTGSFAGNGGFHVGFVQLTNSGAGPFTWHGDGALNGNSIGHNLMGPIASMGRDSFGAAQAMDPYFLGRPSTSLGIGSRGSGSDLYQFADTVLEAESHRSSTRSGQPPMVPPVASAHHSPYLY